MYEEDGCVYEISGCAYEVGGRVYEGSGCGAGVELQDIQGS